MFAGYFEGKTILVTGLAGAKGAWLGWYLLEAGAERIVGVDNAEDLRGTAFEASGLGEEPRVGLHAVDVRDLEALRALMVSDRPDAALHLAARAIVGECREAPLDCYSVNVLGTAAFLEAMRTTGLPRAVMVTTDKVYRDKGGEPWTEEDPLVATGPYAVSKACAEFITQDYRHSYLQPAGRRLATVRAGNVLAPGDHHDGRIFVDVARALARGEPPVIMNPAFTRPYTFVGDTLSGYLAVLARCDEEGIDGEAFNFGPLEARGVPNGDLATRMCELWGGGISWVRGTERDEPFEHQSVDWSKARRVLDWRPAYDLDEGLAAVVEWYRAQAARPAPGMMRELTLEIIRAHIAAARAQGIAWAV